MLKKWLRRVKSNCKTFLIYGAVCIVSVLLLSIIGGFKSDYQTYKTYIGNVLVGAMGSIVASIIFLGYDMYMKFNKDCNRITYKITKLLNEVGYDSNSKSEMHVCDYRKFATEFVITYEFVCMTNSEHGSNKHFSEVAKLLSEIIDKLNNENDKVDIREILTRLNMALDEI